MNNEQLNKVMRLIRRTGDKCVILDNESDAAMVMMGLDDYERLLDNDQSLDFLDEGEMMKKIDRDLSNWRARHDDDDDDSLRPLFDDWRERGKSDDEVIDEIGETGETEEKAENNFDFDNIGAERGTVGEEVSLNDVPQEEEEETFLLEPVE